MSIKSQAKQTERQRRYIKGKVRRTSKTLGEYFYSKPAKGLVRAFSAGAIIKASDRTYGVWTTGAFVRI